MEKWIQLNWREVGEEEEEKLEMEESMEIEEGQRGRKKRRCIYLKPDNWWGRQTVVTFMKNNVMLVTY